MGGFVGKMRVWGCLLEENDQIHATKVWVYVWEFFGSQWEAHRGIGAVEGRNIDNADEIRSGGLHRSLELSSIKF